MRTSSATFSGTVAAPMELVFALLTDPARIPLWLPGCREASTNSNTLARNARFTLHLSTANGDRDIRAVVLEYSPPTTFGWAELAPRSDSKTFFKLQFGGASTHVTMKQVWTPGSWRAWLIGRLFRRRNTHRMFDGLLQNLRKALTR